MVNNNTYDEKYFEDGISNGVSLYENYRWIPELTIPMAYDIILELGITGGHVILDYGCAKGYLVNALRLLGHEAYGVDISEYALKACPHEVEPYLFKVEDVPKEFKNFDWCIAKDVLEHVPYEDLDSTIQWIMDRSKNLFVVVPLGDGELYTIPAMELDKTHIIRESLNWWKNKFMDLGYAVYKSGYSMGDMKDKWVKKFPEGNGFLIITQRRNNGRSKNFK